MNVRTIRGRTFQLSFIQRSYKRSISTTKEDQKTISLQQINQKNKNFIIVRKIKSSSSIRRTRKSKKYK